MKNQQNIKIELQNEVEQYCPALFKKPCCGSFDVPQNYFENNEKKLENHIAAIQRADNINKQLIPPTNYFQKFSQSVLIKVKQEQGTPTFQLSKHVKVIAISVAVAASVALVFWFQFLNEPELKGTQLALRSDSKKSFITIESVHQYLTDESQFIDEQFLMDNMNQLQGLESDDISLLPTSENLNLSSNDEILMIASDIDLFALVESINASTSNNP